MKYKLMKFNARLANATQGMISGRPDVHDEVTSSDDIEEIITTAKRTQGNLHLRVGDSTTQLHRGETKAFVAELNRSKSRY